MRCLQGRSISSAVMSLWRCLLVGCLLVPGPGSQKAWAGFSVSLSASDSTAEAHTATPSGTFRNLYLWASCSDNGLSALEASLDTNLQLLGSFNALNGCLNIGAGPDVLLAVPNCPTDTTLLGYWIVMDQPGHACLAPSQSHGVRAAVDCTAFPALADFDVTGYSSDGTLPCSIGTEGCEGGGARTNEYHRYAGAYASTETESWIGATVGLDAPAFFLCTTDPPSDVFLGLTTLIDYDPDTQSNPNRFMQVGWHATLSPIVYVEFQDNSNYYYNTFVGAPTTSAPYSITPIDLDSNGVLDRWYFYVNGTQLAGPICFASTMTGDRFCFCACEGEVHSVNACMPGTTGSRVHFAGANVFNWENGAAAAEEITLSEVTGGQWIYANTEVTGSSCEFYDTHEPCSALPCSGVNERRRTAALPDTGMILALSQASFAPAPSLEADPRSRLKWSPNHDLVSAADRRRIQEAAAVWLHTDPEDWDVDRGTVTDTGVLATAVDEPAWHVGVNVPVQGWHSDRVVLVTVDLWIDNDGALVAAATRPAREWLEPKTPLVRADSMVTGWGTIAISELRARKLNCSISDVLGDVYTQGLRLGATGQVVIRPKLVTSEWPPKIAGDSWTPNHAARATWLVEGRGCDTRPMQFGHGGIFTGFVMLVTDEDPRHPSTQFLP